MCTGVCCCVLFCEGVYRCVLFCGGVCWGVLLCTVVCYADVFKGLQIIQFRLINAYKKEVMEN